MSQSAIAGASIHAILVHGMGRTPVSMLLLAKRLRSAGITPHLFAYSAAFERWQPCVDRLQRFITTCSNGERFIVVGHSLGCVLTRAVLPQLAQAPQMCFFLAPPTRASSYAIKLSRWRLFKLITGEMGQLLANQKFMESLPMPQVPLRIYAGIKGPRGRWMPFGDEPNDGILSVSEVQLGSFPLQLLPTIHTVIMNSRQVANEIVAAVRK
ncbi:alpha/beta hydrolase family protein [Collimonas arenae]|uniref:Alpha/beta hydrolase family protein n=1 Tax=Collimonas arenae TaxID=279058 RepID=A0A127QMH2_9BURK|nr:alpha/beta hydrolase [Collimonas arenae]AMP01351.1 alpha/beta hydrolase family protein [Collimonas arenae]AMP11250.1 alpha/beta hydrolase family protein [Collimonas arenae]